MHQFGIEKAMRLTVEAVHLLLMESNEYFTFNKNMKKTFIHYHPNLDLLQMPLWGIQIKIKNPFNILSSLFNSYK